MQKCIEKYGEDQGREVFRKRQEKWQTTLINREDYEEVKKKRNIFDIENLTRIHGEEVAKEKLQLYKARVASVDFWGKSSSKKFSKQAKKFFDALVRHYNLPKEECYYAETEYVVDVGSSQFSLDFFHSASNTIIEFNGGAWHPKEGEYNWKSARGGISYEEKYAKDAERRALIEKKLGVEVIVIWSDEVSTLKDAKLKIASLSSKFEKTV